MRPGYDVVGQAGDGEQAVAMAIELRPDIVIMDVKMPVMDGITRRRADRQGADLPGRHAHGVQPDRARRAGPRRRRHGLHRQAVHGRRRHPGASTSPLSRWGELKALEAEVADLGDRLETRKAVDRAKGVLMTKLKITEADAFRWIQKTAMDRRMGMREVADAVIAGMEKA